MANIRGIVGYNRSASSVNKILAAYGNDIVDVAAGTGFPLNLDTSTNIEFETFLDVVFFQNYSNRPKTYNGTSWTTNLVGKTPLAKYIKKFKSRLYLGNCKFHGDDRPKHVGNIDVTFPSRVFYSDFYVGNSLTWGIDWGINGTPVLGTNIFKVTNTGDGTLYNTGFKAYNIKVGDPLTITSFDASTITLNKVNYTVSKIASEYRLEVSDIFLPNTDNNIHYWVGSNWFDVATDDNDQITGMGENSDRLLIFKLMSLWFYTGSQLRKVKDAVGTSSHRSIINHRGNTYYFHGSNPLISGIYKYDGVNSTLISRGLDPYIRGMSASVYDDVVAWQEGEELRWYLGTLTNSNYNVSMTNAVATLNTVTGAWDVSPIADTVTASTVFRTSGQEDTYVGTSDDEVLKMGSGNSFNGSAINALLDTKPYYPTGTDVINDFTKIQVIGRSVKGTKVKYKLWNTPRDVDDEWYSIGELTGDKTELDIPTEHNQGSGIQLRFEDVGTLENDAFVEKFTIFYKPDRRRFL